MNNNLLPMNKIDCYYANTISSIISDIYNPNFIILNHFNKYL